jgi:hypothetical protein
MGNAYGSPLWHFPAEWRPFLDLPGGNSLTHYFDLFHMRPWFKIVPDPKAKIIIEGAGIYAQNDYAIAGSDKNGRFIVAYIPSGRSFKINTELLKGKKVNAGWFNPRNGSMQAIGEYNLGIISFKTPDEKDWVLIVDTK